MIRRFVLLSIALHLLVALVLVDSNVSRLAAPSAALQATLAAPQTRALTRGRPANDTDTLVLGAPPLLTAMQDTVRVDAPTTDTSRSAPVAGHGPVDADAGTQAIVNRLVTELRAAFDAGFIYPPLARRHGWQGRVQLGLTVGADGRLSDLCVLSSSGHPVLDQDAVRTLARIGALPRATDILSGRHVRLQLPVYYRLIES